MSQQLLSFLDASPVAFWATENLIQQFSDASWILLNEQDDWELIPGQGYLVRQGPGCLVAFTLGSPGQVTGWNVAAAHTDSPGLKVKLGSAQQLEKGLVRWGVEVYGSPIFATWMDRSLGLAGAVWVKGKNGPVAKPLKTEALAVVPNLAIHYNREANKGLALDPQTQLSAVADAGPFVDWPTWLSERIQTPRPDFLAAELFLWDTQPSQVSGPSGLYQSGRIDNLAGCQAIAEALIAATRKQPQGYRIALFLDNEEIGSQTPNGAQSSLLPRLLDRLEHQARLTREQSFRKRSASFLVSVDAAHGLHPNYSDRHDPAFAPVLGGGPVLKASARASYSTTAENEAIFRWKIHDYQGPLQSFIMRSDLVPGSTVGPLLAAGAQIHAIDLGVPIWAMHSIRETAHLSDQSALIDLLQAYWQG